MGRKERWILNGVEYADRHRGAVEVTPSYIAFIWRSVTSRIPAQFAVGAAQHEAGFSVNEVDTETNGFVSKGWAQVSDAEASMVGCHGANLLDPAVCALVFARLMENAYYEIEKHGIPPKPDVWAYLGIWHNEGGGTYSRDGKGALGTICRFGVDWEDYKTRERRAAARLGRPVRGIVKYGDDVISGGERWHEVGK
jgi:hypothetical protein